MYMYFVCACVSGRGGGGGERRREVQDERRVRKLDQDFFLCSYQSISLDGTD